MGAKGLPASTFFTIRKSKSELAFTFCQVLKYCTKRPIQRPQVRVFITFGSTIN